MQEDCRWFAYVSLNRPDERLVVTGAGRTQSEATDDAMGYCQTLVNSAGSGSCDFADACCASASPDGDASQTGPLHGSIAFSRDADGSYAWGIAWSFDSSAGAEAEALGQCRAHDGTRCSQAGWFREACGALAIGDDNGYGAGWGATAAAAKHNALAQCRASNNDCRIEVARCAQSEQAGGSGRTEREDTARRRPSNAVQPANNSKPACSSWVVQVALTGAINRVYRDYGSTPMEAEKKVMATCQSYQKEYNRTWKAEGFNLSVDCVVRGSPCCNSNGESCQ